MNTNEASGGLRIAMWSGPRNISTALMRAWENRSDTTVWDEPLYAHYLTATGLDHPGAQEVIDHHDADWRSVTEALVGPIPGGHAIWYQKHMAHHLLPEIERGWLDSLTHAFLIRDPKEMLLSLVVNLPNARLEDTGLPQQVELFDALRERGLEPPVLDSRDVLEDPEGQLRALCDAVGVAFDPAMLSWPAGSRESDGIWARHWYASVDRSTGFGPYRPKTEAMPSALGELADRCRPYYERLREHRLVTT